MDKYLSLDELLQRWDIKDFQLLDFIDDGLIPYNQRYDAIPVKILNHVKLPDGFLNSIGRYPTREELKGVYLDDLKLCAFNTFENHYPNIQETLKHIPKYIIENMVQALLAIRDSSTEQIRKLLDCDDRTITIDLKKPEQLQRLNMLVFLRKDIEFTEKRNPELIQDEQRSDNHELELIETRGQHRQQKTNEIKDPESFIRSLQVGYVSDTEVSIKVGDNKAKNYPCGEMGFKSAENGWKLLMEVLKAGDNLFYAGPYSKDKIPEKNKRYNQRQKWITQFTKKFINFLNREYCARIPDKTKLLENQKKKNRDGLYKPIFQVASSDAIHSTDIKKMSKQVILKEIEKLVNDKKREKNEKAREGLLSRIGDYAAHAYKNRWITQEHLRNMISLPDEEIPVSPGDALSCSGESNTANDF